MYAHGEIGSRNIVHGNDDHSPQSTSKECSNPLGAVFTPEENAVALADLAEFEFTCELPGGVQDLVVSPTDRPVSVVIDKCGFGRVPLVVVQVIEQGAVRHARSF